MRGDMVSYPPYFFGEIAQLVERRTHKPKVKGSIPFLATISPADAPQMMKICYNMRVRLLHGDMI